MPRPTLSHTSHTSTRWAGCFIAKCRNKVRKKWPMAWRRPTTPLLLCFLLYGQPKNPFSLPLCPHKMVCPPIRSHCPLLNAALPLFQIQCRSAAFLSVHFTPIMSTCIWVGLVGWCLPADQRMANALRDEWQIRRKHWPIIKRHSVFAQRPNTSQEINGQGRRHLHGKEKVPILCKILVSHFPSKMP